MQGTPVFRGRIEKIAFNRWLPVSYTIRKNSKEGAMPIVDAKQMLLKATVEKYAVGAFNCTNLIQMGAVVEAAVEMKAPLILQVSVAPS